MEVFTGRIWEGFRHCLCLLKAVEQVGVGKVVSAILIDLLSADSDRF